MSELAVILADFFPSTSLGEQAERSAASLPRLPALETVLTRAQRRALPAGWRGWLADRSGAATAMTAPAQLVARTLADEPGGTRAAQAAGRWLATPVHLFAGLDSVHLHPCGLLRLEADEQRTLVEQFAQVFADTPWRLHALGQRELLLSGPPLQASAGDPAAVLGADPSAAMPAGTDAPALRGLGSEIELWLFEHPLNQARVARGELPVTTLWLWGAGVSATSATASATGRARPRVHLYGRDTVAEALWREQGGEPVRAVPDDATQVLRARGEHIVLQSLAAEGSLGGAFERLERHWLAPSLDALRRRHLRRLWLLSGTQVWRLGWLDLARAWRARAPWWQRLI